MPRQTPLADRMRPKNIDEVAGQQHILAPGKLLRRMIDADQLSSIIFYGPPGTGKTSLAHVIANHTNSQFCQINATTAGKADMKKVIDSAIKLWETEDRGTILFIDEIHRFNKAQQDYLLPFVENGTIVLIGATTENPYFEVNGALLSRSRIFELKPLTESDIVHCIHRAMLDSINGYGNGYNGHNVLISEDAIRYISKIVDGDVRQALNAFQLAVETTDPLPNGIINIETNTVMECLQKRVMRFDKQGDNHYDFISAFIESMRHSDPDASIYYLARMIEAGEDPKYIARRLMIFASDDIGLSDSHALDIAVNAFLVIERVGMPECVGALAQSTLYNATAPKSNVAISTLGKARELVKQTGNIQIPAFLQDESYKSAHKLGRGGVTDVYVQPYNYDGTDCMPMELKGIRLFSIEKPMGHENTIKQFLDWCKTYKNQLTDADQARLRNET